MILQLLYPPTLREAYEPHRHVFMATFNPMMLDASIRDVVSHLSSDQKATVLLYAMERLPLGPSSRTVIENGVQSCIQVASMHPGKVAQARILRAKVRFSVGLRGAAHQDLQAVLMTDPNNSEARALMPPSGRIYAGQHIPFPSRQSLTRAITPPRFSSEIWREIASYLPRRDLRNLLLVPHALSTIAGQLLFRKVHLQFNTAQYYSAWQEKDVAEEVVELDKWHAQRSADILSRLVSDAAYAGLVRTFIVSAPAASIKSTLTAFQIAMLANVLPRLVNLEVFGCTMGNHAIGQIFTVLEKHHPNLRELIVDSTAPSPPPLPNLPSLTHYTYNGVAEETPNVRQLFTSRSVAMHTLVIRGRGYPIGITAPSNLTVLDLSVNFERADALSDILTQSTQLETLRLACSTDADVRLSTVIRAHTAALPALREFAFSLHIALAPRGLSDADLFPALADFVRGHPDLVTLALSAGWRPAVGFDATVWGVLPALSHLHTLQIDVPADLSPALSAWLIPRTVVALTLLLPPKSDPSFLTQLWAGLPRDLKIVVLPFKMSTDLQDTIGSRLPSVRLLCLSGTYYTVQHTGAGGTQLEQWPQRRTVFSFNDYVEEIDCEEVKAFASTERWHW
ncbi:hypothetical protein FA95DRAFT_960723 [Auriscalpium vulgare]|uniref:Uncharacterized protein n=1 Tax=Auriscalpium vulgare TaxID=40419 RepID=A0ACB8RYD1_9AGAM|nr:hypothetical protein FA95DRAFT_960723 [Auriscalpium vulgare]